MLIPNTKIVSDQNGNLLHYYRGLLHREDGPAVVGINGYMEWRINGRLHREDGPAIEYAAGGKIYYLCGIFIPPEEFKALLENDAVEAYIKALEL